MSDLNPDLRSSLEVPNNNNNNIIIEDVTDQVTENEVALNNATTVIVAEPDTALVNPNAEAAGRELILGGREARVLTGDEKVAQSFGLIVTDEKAIQRVQQTMANLQAAHGDITTGAMTLTTGAQNFADALQNGDMSAIFTSAFTAAGGAIQLAGGVDAVATTTGFSMNSVRLNPITKHYVLRKSETTDGYCTNLNLVKLILKKL